MGRPKGSWTLGAVATCDVDVDVDVLLQSISLAFATTHSSESSFISDVTRKPGKWLLESSLYMQDE
jgi:hypothetical protein